MNFLALLLAAVLDTSCPPNEASHAIAQGRLDQAQQLISKSIAAGDKGQCLDLLLADHEFARARYEEAFARYELLARDSRDPIIHERAGLAAMRIGRTAEAKRFIEAALSGGASWQAWNAQGILSDLAGDWEQSDVAYKRALTLAPDRPEVLNNQGWSLLLQGRWDGALQLFQLALERSQSSARIRANVDLARMALDENLPDRLTSESAAEWATRLNDAGVAALARGDRARAEAAFAQALLASSNWFERAANNLLLAEQIP